MHRRNIPLKFFLGVLGFSAALVVTLALILSDSAPLRIAGALLAVLLLAWWLVAPLLDAHQSERHVEQFPELLRNNAIGKYVVAASDFRPAEDGASGTVLLNGEKWRARCAPDCLPERGQSLCVYGREGLTLLVRPLGKPVAVP
jgi:membrane protein implicated in regulation of membrane protease activity